MVEDLNGEEIDEFGIENKVKKGKLYVKWKGYNNSFSSSIDKKRYHYMTWATLLNRIAIVLTKQKIN